MTIVMKMIQYLQENHVVLNLLKEQKVSLLGVNKDEVSAILAAYEDDVKNRVGYWQ